MSTNEEKQMTLGQELFVTTGAILIVSVFVFGSMIFVLPLSEWLTKITVNYWTTLTVPSDFSLRSKVWLFPLLIIIPTAAMQYIMVWRKHSKKD